ncbi:Cytochrome c oxidase, subunit VIb [Cordyceps fumosorosea ARSEF 2679]|uniref:Cytochrome c oxidase, subunit VIb n=1 Tax=Cordyceps fumosorosea (strain ARSEF 2679) TaxID=1081104 RepID=A0A162KCI4_CORFA|nr:Cytochrome c oxidase, subunit VIb [Cordyceps fumosorosea ARSEF 2679]OAA66058.1 Cytochrome c oxidase, subunit VIb [Cordyceps fumosorosea ARSEF 2679]
MERRRHPHAHRARRVLDLARRLEPGASEAARACPEATAAFERDCAAAWVKYFKQWRVADAQKRRRIEQLQAEGAVEANVTSSFAGGGNISGSSGKAQATKEDIQAMLDKKRG